MNSSPPSKMRQDRMTAKEGCPGGKLRMELLKRDNDSPLFPPNTWFWSCIRWRILQCCWNVLHKNANESPWGANHSFENFKQGPPSENPPWERKESFMSGSKLRESSEAPRGGRGEGWQVMWPRGGPGAVSRPPCMPQAVWLSGSTTSDSVIAEEVLHLSESVKWEELCLLTGLSWQLNEMTRVKIRCKIRALYT